LELPLPPAAAITVRHFFARVYFSARIVDRAMADLDPSSFLSSNTLQSAAVLTIVLAFAGYLVTFMSNRMMARRADRLRLVNQRLNKFYGPLYVATVAGNIAYKSLLAKQG
jgi:hypothetical protein